MARRRSCALPVLSDGIFFETPEPVFSVEILLLGSKLCVLCVLCVKFFF
jgi:hypothetical protein